MYYAESVGSIPTTLTNKSGVMKLVNMEVLNTSAFWLAGANPVSGTRNII
mgnify:CR=1 FL=1